MTCRPLAFDPRIITLWMALSLLPAWSRPAVGAQSEDDTAVESSTDEGCTNGDCPSDDGSGDCETGEGCRRCRRGPKIHGGHSGAAGGAVNSGGTRPYVAPLPVPERGGSTYITYPPVAPHEFLSPHSRVYRTDYSDGSYTKTKVSWSWRPWNQYLGCGPRVLPNPQRGINPSDYWKVGWWGVDGRLGWGQNGMWR